MRLLLDTHLLLWASSEPEKLSREATNLINNLDNILLFSAASIWEIAVKASLKRRDFKVNPSLLRRGLLENNYEELPVTSLHALGVEALPPIHQDPFDRLLISQAINEGILLITHNTLIQKYPAPIRAV